MKIRQDAWTSEDDLLLAETVLRHIRDGSTQLQAFDEVGDILNRTSAACGFRWNAEVRPHYEEAVQIAKRKRKEQKRAQAPILKKSKPIRELNRPSLSSHIVIDAEFTEEVPKTISLEDVISFLQTWKHNANNTSQAQVEHDLLQRENEELQKKNEELEKKLASLLEQQATIEEDYQTLVRIMDRARKMVLFDDVPDRMAPIFKMDQNGNLEIISN
ncbi:RsfA family transcriptional regulator [Microbacteriaceae bacterium 4G12]